MARPATPLEVVRDTAIAVATLVNELSDLSKFPRQGRIDFEFLEFTLESWATLLSDTNVQDLYAGDAAANSSEQRIRPTIPQRVLAGVRSDVDQVRRALVVGDSEQVKKAAESLFELFAVVAHELRDQARIPLSTGLQELIGRYDYKRRMKAADDLKRQAEQLVASTQESAVRASEAATSASEAAGTAGESVMASYFKDFAKEEWESAAKFRLWTIILLAFGGGLAAVFLLLPAFGVAALSLDTGDYVHLAQRVIVTAAVFALAAYLARQSHQHRTLANWAKTLSVQLKTFDAFMAPLDSNDAKEALRAQFAARVFGEPPVLRGDASPDDSSPIPEKMWEMLTRNLGKPQ